MEGELAKSKARLPSLLLALLGLGPELLFGQARAQPREVNGVLGGSVLLSPALPPNKTVKEIEWSFYGAGAIQVAEFGPGGLRTPRPQGSVQDRLEMFNDVGAEDEALERGDSGVYGARLKLHPALVEDQFFNLSVYESVPSPRTRSQLLASTVEWCNLTLQCQGAGKCVNVTRDNVIWDLISDRHQLSPDGTTLRVALPPTAANVTYACTVSNPADRKVVLFDLQAICQSGGDRLLLEGRGTIVLTLIPAVSLGGAFWCWRMNSEKAADPAATPTVPAEESPSDPQYAEIARSPPEGNDQGLGHPENTQEQTAQKAPVKVYEQIRRAPEDTAEEGDIGPQPREVNGVLGGSVLLSLALPLNRTLKEIEWSFSASTGPTILVAEFGPNGFKRPNLRTRFKDRLEMFNETMLKIWALERGDSGVYKARLILYPALVENRFFNLVVYGPVPAPEIQPKQFSFDTQGCNVTLRCWVPDGSGAEAAWQFGSSLDTVGDNSARTTRRCAGRAITAFNSSYTCVARNPIQERNVSILLDTLCRTRVKSTPPAPGFTQPVGSWHPPWLVPAATYTWWRWHVCLVLLAVGAGALTPHRLPVEEDEEEESSRGSRPRIPLQRGCSAGAFVRRDPEENPPGGDKPQRDHPTTIYSQVQTGSWAEVLA
ncbi:LOW QUALITY PROTEIN: uncharacterized protein FYN16_013482 [Cariama cristata]